MKKILSVLLGAALLGAVGLAQTGSKAAGHWQGKIQMPNRDLSITVDLARNPKGEWIGSMSVVGSSSKDVPLNSVTVEDTAVRFTANLPEPASFAGHLSADASNISGKATNAAGEAEFQLTRDGEANERIPPPSSALSKEFEGRWEGALDSGGRVRRVGLRLWPAADGTAKGVLIAVDHGNLEIPVSTVTIKDREIVLESRAVSGTYRGKLGASGEIAGEWAEGPARLPLALKRVGAEEKK